MTLLREIKQIAASFNDWYSLYQGSKRKSDLSNLALLMMLKTASTLKDLKILSKYIKTDKEKEAFIMKIVEKTDDFQELCDVCTISKKECNVLAVRKILEKDLTFHELSQVSELPIHDSFKDIIFKLMLKKAETEKETLQVMCKSGNDPLKNMIGLNPSDQTGLSIPEIKNWPIIYICATERSRTEIIALINFLSTGNESFIENMIQSFDDFQEWDKLFFPMDYKKRLSKIFTLYESLPDNNKIKEKILERLAVIDICRQEFWDFYEPYLFLEDTRLKEIIFDVMMQRAKGFWEWRSIYNLVPENNEVKELALRKMAETAKGSEEKLRTCYCTPQNSDLRKEIGQILKDN